MADTVQLNVTLNQGNVLAQLQAIDAQLTSIQAKSKIQISVGTSTLTRAANQSQKLAQNMTHLQQTGQQAGQAVQQTGQQATKAMQTTAAAARSAERSTSLLGTALGNMAKMAFWQISGRIVSATFKAFENGIQTMRDVDTELVNIRKVTGWSKDQLDELTRTAYSTASAYGRTATEVLSASTVFARAGYGEQISQLSELSVLLQNVGQLTDDQAAKFIISTDKAYKLGGAYDKLLAVIDGVDNVTNRNATDMQNMTEGMTVAGSVFAQAGESIESFVALLGTATANTQRSGSEVARGLRTILMNIRQIQGTTEDGELIDGESWSKASKALREFAGISTTENGQLRKTFDVLRDLARVWGDLDSVGQSAIAEALAGKRQANILSSIMGDWPSVEKMLSEYINGAGTALKENEAFLDSWEAKSAQISATWSEFINKVIGSEAVKAGQDAWLAVLNGLVDLVTSDSEKAEEATKGYRAELEAVKTERDALIAQGDTLNAQDRQRLTYLEQREKYLNRQIEESRRAEFDAWQKEVGTRQMDFGAVGNGVSNDVAQLVRFTQAVEDASQGFLAGKITAQQFAESLGSVIGEVGSYTEAAKKWQAEGYTLESSQQKLIAGYNMLLSAMTDSENEYIQYAAAVKALALANGATEAEAAQQAVDALNNLTQARKDAYRTQVEYDYGAEDAIKISELLGNSLRLLSQNYQLISNEDLSGVVEGYRKLVEPIQKVQEAGAELTASQSALLSAFDALSSAAQSGASGAEAYEAIQSAVETLSSAVEEVPETTDANITTNAPEATEQVNTLAASIASLKDKTVNIFVKVHGGLSSIFSHASGTDYAPGGPTLVNEEGPELIAANGLAWIAAGGKPTVTTVPRGATVYTAQETKALFNGGASSVAMPTFSGGTDAAKIEEARAWINNLSKGVTYTPEKDRSRPFNYERDSKTRGKSKSSDWSSSGDGDGGGGGGPTPPDFKALEDALKDTLKNLDLQAELAENQEDFVKAMQIYGRAQGEINKLLEQYRANGYAEDSTEILTLMNRGYSYAGKQDKDYDEVRDRLIDALEELTRATDDANELAERREAVEKARESLENAQRQRTVRIFNPITGQWEWAANAESIRQAQENLKDAEYALQKEEISQTIDALERAEAGSFEDVPISQALQELISSAPGGRQSEILSLFGAAASAEREVAAEGYATPFNQGSVTNIGTQYTFGDLTLSEEEAAGMTVKDLADKLRVLNIMQ